MRYSELVLDHCLRYYATFSSFARLAKYQFEQQLWQAQRAANNTRIRLLDRFVNSCLEALRKEGIPDKNTWEQVRERIIADRSGVPYPVLLSFIRVIEERLLEDQCHPVQSWLPSEPSAFSETTVTDKTSSSADLACWLIDLPGFEKHYIHREGLETGLAAEIDALGAQVERVEACQHLFYRNQHAYLLGRLLVSGQTIPFVVPFVHGKEGIRCDALLTGEDKLIRIFEFTRSYFLVETSEPEGLVGFLTELMPSKQRAQLIINLGFQEWGKSLLKNEFCSYCCNSTTKLDHAPGIRGMVMCVFTLPDFPMVFKVIRNVFPPSKEITPEEVITRYRFVAEQDRVGRMADAQLFHAWNFPAVLFESGLLDSLENECSDRVTRIDDRVIIRDVFTERKMIPLNIYLKEASENEAKRITDDYGKAIKEMAMSNIFPGDLLLKNFGVTPRGKVVFYDYDEVVPLTECRFVCLPEPQSYEQAIDAEPWIALAPDDIVPDQLEKFMLPAGPLRTFFREKHGDLFETGFWKKWQAFHRKNRLIDLQPYSSSRRISKHAAD